MVNFSDFRKSPMELCMKRSDKRLQNINKQHEIQSIQYSWQNCIDFGKFGLFARSVRENNTFCLNAYIFFKLRESPQANFPSSCQFFLTLQSLWLYLHLTLPNILILLKLSFLTSLSFVLSIGKNKFRYIYQLSHKYCVTMIVIFSLFQLQFFVPDSFPCSQSQQLVKLHSFA